MPERKPQPEQSEQSERVEQLVALAPMRNGRLLLALGEVDRWQVGQGYQMAPVELIGGPCAPTSSPTDELRRLAEARLNCDAAITPSAHVYGPSTKHAIDRLAADPTDPMETPTPLLRLRRMLPRDDETGADVRPIDVRVYLARLAGNLLPYAGVPALLWLTPTALRRVIGGLSLGELLTSAGATIQTRPDITLADDLLLYCPGEYGERYLLRIAAKYGPAALLQEDYVAPLHNTPLL
ncbi:MAG: hypothetical protein ABI068_04860 [Ktedonobacterales bacterium]